jgi:hypothetical protein
LRHLFVIVCLVAGLAIGLVLFMPLAAILKLSGAQARGLSWTSVEGTLSGGEIRGLRAGTQLLGDGALKLRPATLLRFGAGYAFSWSGPAGSGTGRAAVFPDGTIELQDYTFRLDLAALDGLALWIRQSGGEARLSGPLIRLSNGRCDKAEGVITSDALTRNEALLGPGWPEMTGKIACLGPDLAIPLAAQSASGTRIDTLARFNLQRTGSMEARVSGFVPQDFQYALPIAGFVPDGGAYVYLYPAAAAEVQP